MNKNLLERLKYKRSRKTYGFKLIWLYSNTSGSLAEMTESRTN
jgi:hypothetical protein